VSGLSFLSASLALVLFAGVAAVSVPRGAALYHGKEPLQGRIRGHDDVLPPETVVCANCHSAKSTSRLSGSPAPQINSSLLLEMRQRHGGPPSRYNQAAFCRLMRTGSDPAYVLIAREMPAYDLSNDQCASLWLYLSGKEAAHENP
jgi:hypothetical protein